MKIATVKEEDGTHTGLCDGVALRLCGNPTTGEPFATRGWPTAAIAEDRIRQHLAEHNGDPSEPLSEFRARHNLAAGDDGNAYELPAKAKTLKTEEE